MTASKRIEAGNELRRLFPSSEQNSAARLTIIRAAGGLAVAAISHIQLDVGVAGITRTEAFRLSALSVDNDATTFETHTKQWNILDGRPKPILLNTCGLDCDRLIFAQEKVHRSSSGINWTTQPYEEFAERLHGSFLEERAASIIAATPEEDVFAPDNNLAMAQAREVLTDHTLISNVARAAFGLRPYAAIGTL